MAPCQNLETSVIAAATAFAARAVTCIAGLADNNTDGSDDSATDCLSFTKVLICLKILEYVTFTFVGLEMYFQLVYSKIPR
ncbi:hypothetical protein MFLAVUS_001399 [Mucor flavus]|uniref:Uncharacterized protein n=1 Tax=Mucor flavus TaxID=439312 RepID=A0ABP9YME5_9FUNG